MALYSARVMGSNLSDAEASAKASLLLHLPKVLRNGGFFFDSAWLEHGAGQRQGHGFESFRCRSLGENKLILRFQQMPDGDIFFVKGFYLLPIFKYPKTEFMCCAYILFSPSLGKYYMGSTTNLWRRLEEHNNGSSTYTKKGIPWFISYAIKCDSIFGARELEAKIKKRGAQRYLDSLQYNILSSPE